MTRDTSVTIASRTWRAVSSRSGKTAKEAREGVVASLRAAAPFRLRDAVRGEDEDVARGERDGPALVAHLAVGAERGERSLGGQVRRGVPCTRERLAETGIDVRGGTTTSPTGAA